MGDREVLIESALGKGAAPFEYDVSGRTRVGWKKQVSRNGDGDVETALRHVEQWWRSLHAADVRLFVGSNVADLSVGPAGGLDHATAALDPDAPLHLFALPDLPTLDVVEFSRTGSHHAPPASFQEGVWVQLKQQLVTLDPALLDRYGGDSGVQQWVSARRHGPEPWRSVRKALAAIMDLCPFAILLADEGSLHATFLKPVPDELAPDIANLILQINPEALEIPPAELQRLGLCVPLDAAEPQIPDYDAALLRYITTAGRFQLWWG